MRGQAPGARSAPGPGAGLGVAAALERAEGGRGRETHRNGRGRLGQARSQHWWPGLGNSGRERGGRATWGPPQLAPFTDFVGFQCGPFRQSPGLRLGLQSSPPAGWTGRQGRGHAVRPQPLAT